MKRLVLIGTISVTATVLLASWAAWVHESGTGGARPDLLAVGVGPGTFSVREGGRGAGEPDLLARTAGSGCSEAPRCAATASSPTLGIPTADLEVTGLVETRTLISGTPARVELEWDAVNLEGTFAETIPIEFTLNPDRGPSLAIIESLGSETFPAYHTNLYYFEVYLPSLQITLENLEPIELSSTVNDWPPDRDPDHLYELINGPVDFYFKGDVSGLVAITLESAFVTLEPPVGGIAEPPDVDGLPPASAQSGGSSFPYAAVAGIAAAAVAVVAAGGGWYVRRRTLR